MRTTDAGATWTQVFDGTAGGHSAGRLYRAKDGAYYIGTVYGVIRSAPGADGASWSLLPNSGGWVHGITGNGTTIYANSGSSGGFLTSTDGITWTKMAGQSPHHSDGCGADYDQGHDILYSSCGLDGFHRMRVK